MVVGRGTSEGHLAMASCPRRLRVEWLPRGTWGRAVSGGMGGRQAGLEAGHCPHTAPNQALEPTPTASARPSLWLLARLMPGVRWLVTAIQGGFPMSEVLAFRMCKRP